MKKKLRIVLDTNVIISAFVFSGDVPRKVFDYVKEDCEIVMSRQMFEELESTLKKEKLSKYINIELKDKFLRLLQRKVTWVNISGKECGCRDKYDDMVLETAENGKAKYIITGDKDLLVMEQFKNINIINPQDFLQSVYSK